MRIRTTELFSMKHLRMLAAEMNATVDDDYVHHTIRVVANPGRCWTEGVSVLTEKYLPLTPVNYTQDVRRTARRQAILTLRDRMNEYPTGTYPVDETDADVDYEAILQAAGIAKKYPSYNDRFSKGDVKKLIDYLTECHNQEVDRLQAKLDHLNRKGNL